MTSTYHANPYNFGVAGFYFDSLGEYQVKAALLRDSHGQPVEEFEIQYIDGNGAALFEACGVTQGNLEQWFDEVECLDDDKKAALYFLCTNHGATVENALEQVDNVSMTEGTLLQAATDLFDELYLSDVPQAVRGYIDYEAYARDQDLNGDMTEFDYNGTTYTCTNAGSL